MFSIYSPSLTHCTINLCSFRLAKFLHSSNFCSLVDPNFCGSILFRKHSRKCMRRFLEFFVFIRFASTVLSNTSRRTIRYFTPLLSLASSSTHARSIHQISFYNHANAFILFISRVAKFNFVYDCFESK